MFKFRLTFEELHLFIGGGQKLLIDTGSPQSFSRLGMIRIGDVVYKVPEKLWNIADAERLSGWTGVQHDGLIGTDILNRYDVLFDVPNKSAVFTEKQLEPDGFVLPTQSMVGTPLVTPDVDGRPRTMIFDTGAPLSYATKPVVNGAAPVGSYDDFFPTVGRFTTRTYKLPVRLGTYEKDMLFGDLPDCLKALEYTCAGIIGNDVMADRKLWYLPRSNQMVLGRPE